MMTDIKFSIRGLLRRPGLAAVIVLTLALGIGVNSGIFSLFYQILLQPMPVHDPGSLVILESPGPKSGSASSNNSGSSDQIFSIPMYRDLRENPGDLEGIAGYRSIGANLSWQGQTRSGNALLVSDNYFSLLGLVPAAGRLFIDGEVEQGSDLNVAILNHGYWVDEFNADPDVIGEALMVNGELMTIIGVAPRGFDGLNPFVKDEVYLPLMLAFEMDAFAGWELESRRAYWVYMFGRLSPGSDIDSASASINPFYQSVLREVEAPLQEGASDDYLQRFVGKELVLLPGRSGQTGLHSAAEQPMQMLIAVSLLVLLVACVNVANLLLAFGARERGEIAVRTALGASYMHIFSRRMIQIVALGLVGAVCSIPVALIVMNLFLMMIPTGLGSALDGGMHLQMLVLALVVAFAAIMIAGLIPILQALKVSPMAVIRDQNGQAGSSVKDLRFRSALVVTQIAFSICLLIVAGLFSRSLSNIDQQDLGMQIDQLITFQISPEQNGYSFENSQALFQTLEEQLKVLPGVESASVSLVQLLSDSNWMSGVSIEGYDETPDSDMGVYYNGVGADFFDTFSVPVLAGRSFNRSDSRDRPQVGIVNQAFVERFGLGDDVIGRRFSFDGDEPDTEIIGLVADAAYSSLKADKVAQFYRSFHQFEDTGTAAFYVRYTGDSDLIADSIRGLVNSLDSNLPIDDLSEVPFVARENVFFDRLISTLAMLFAVLATVLAAIGLYGVLTFMLAQRTREFGLRAALGAAPESIRTMVLLHVAKLALIGTLIGVVLAIFLGRAAENLLFGIQPMDPLIIGSAVLILGLVISFSGYLPARKAARIDPIEALRYE